MPEDNLALFRRCFDAYNRRDVEALVRDLDPRVAWHPALEAMLGGEATVYRGHDGVRRIFDIVGEAFTDFRAEAFDVRDLGDRIVGTGRLSAVGKGSGVGIESPFGLVFDIAGGQVTKVRTYLDPAEALRAAGVE
jgi:ketosteroid isomerase-like protein